MATVWLTLLADTAGVHPTQLGVAVRAVSKARSTFDREIGAVTRLALDEAA